MRKSLTLKRVMTTLVVGSTIVSCGSDGRSGLPASTPAAADAPKIVVTTNILGDIVSQVVGDLASVEVVMPLGSDPHNFAPSARQADSMEAADLLVINGAGFEEGMLDIIDNIRDSGTEVFAFADQVELRRLGAGEDPHIWTDPTRMITAVEALNTELVDVEGLDGDTLADQVDAYLAALGALDSAMSDTLSSIPDEQRILVTNHEVFSYFADRFGFEVVGAIIPSLSTNAAASASQIEALATLVEANGIPAIFGETTQSTQLAEALAAAVGNDVQVVALFSESLGGAGSGAETYVDMMNTNARLISDALSP